MGRARILAVALAALAELLATGSADAGESVIVVTGSGSVEVQPDRVTIEFTVLSRAGSAAEASEGSVRRTAPILAALHTLGVPDSAITSTVFAVQPSWDFKRGMRKE